MKELRIVLAIGVGAAVLGAWMFRYAPIASGMTDRQAALMWDRWTHQLCIAVTDGPILCSVDEMNAYRASKAEHAP